MNTGVRLLLNASAIAVLLSISPSALAGSGASGADPWVSMNPPLTRQATNPIIPAVTSLVFEGREQWESHESQRLQIRNNGPAVTLSLTSDADWINGYNAGIIEAGETRDIVVTAASTHLLQGVHKGNLFLNVPGHAPIAIAITFNVGLPMVHLVPGSMTFNVDVDKIATQTLRVFKATPLDLLVVMSGPGGVSVGPLPMGVVSQKETELTVRVDARLIPVGSHENVVNFLDLNGRTVAKLPVFVNVLAVGGLTASPPSVSLAADSPTAAAQKAAILVTNVGSFVLLTLSTNRDWLSASTGFYIIDSIGVKTIDVLVVANPSILAPGTHHGEVTIEAPNRPRLVIPVTFTVGGASAVTVSPSTISLSGTLGSATPASAQATLSASGISTGFQAAPSHSWLSVSPPSGQIASGASASLTIQAHAQGLAAGTHNGAISISTGTQLISLPVTLTLSAPSALVVTPTSIEFTGLGSSPPARKMVSVTTQSGAAAQFTFTHQSDGGWLIVEQAGGQLSVGVNPLLLATSPSTGTIQINSAPSDGRTYTVQVTARKSPAPVSWAMPQVADGGGFTTSITLLNPSAAEAIAALRFRRNKQNGTHATEDWTPATAGGQSFDAIRIPAKSAVTIETLGAAQETSSGWVEVTGPSNLGGFAVFRQTNSSGNVQEASVPMSGAAAAQVVLPYDNTSGWVTSFALVNRDLSAPLAVNCVLRDETGRTLLSGPFILMPAAGHYAARLIDIFPSSNGKRGSFVLSAPSASISALALRFNPQGAFTSLETTPDAPSGAGRQVFAQVADGGGFNTLLTLQNNNTAAVTASIRFRRAVPGSNGISEPWQPPIEGGASTSSVVIPAGGAYAVRTVGLGETASSGWAEVESPSPLSGTAVFSFKPGQSAPQEASVALKAGKPAGFHLPFDNTLGFVTSIALANIDSAAEARLSVVLRGEDGAVLGQQTIEIPASGHLAFETVTRLAATAGRRGSAEFTIESGWVAAIGLRFSPSGPFTSFQPQYW